MYFNQEIILFHRSAADCASALKLLAGEFLKKKLVTNRFLEGILEREKKYPTGLNVNGLGIAIPHTDSNKVIISQLGFMSLTKPVKFKEMGSDTGTVDVSMIFMLGLKNAKDQLNMLQRLMALFQNEHLVGQLQTCDRMENFIEMMRQAGIK